jgi:tetratricopeptide (TPR) repeat protein
MAVLAGQVAGHSPGVALLGAWLADVEQHEPGVVDAPIERLSSWTSKEFDRLLPYFWAWLEFSTDSSRETLQNPRRRFDRHEVEAIQALSSESANRGGANRVLKLAAQLHADVAILARPAGEQYPPGTRVRTERVPPGALEERRLRILAPDARLGAIERDPLHWTFARALLDQITPDPSADPWVARWYRASAAAEAGEYRFADAGALLRHARKILPEDPRIFFASGCLLETLSSPAVLDFIAATALPGGLQFAVGSSRESLQEAEAYYRRALMFDPTLVDARLRLARVVARLGRTEEAAASLESLLAGPPPPPSLSFLAAMFMADIEQARGRDDRALPLIEQAAALYPRSQSAHMALGLLARRRGETEAAYAAPRRAIDLPVDRSAADDPWWDDLCSTACEPRISLRSSPSTTSWRSPRRWGTIGRRRVPPWRRRRRGRRPPWSTARLPRWSRPSRTWAVLW